MHGPFKKIYDQIYKFVQKESSNNRTIGIVLFGSYARGNINSNSDIDLLIIEESPSITSQKILVEDKILHVHRWPVNVFNRLFVADFHNPYSGAFCLDVVRSCRILYDPKGVVKSYKKHVDAISFPSLYTLFFLRKAEKRLYHAQAFMSKGCLERAELLARKASEDLGRAYLLKNGSPQIFPAKFFAPKLRQISPDFWEIFAEVNNIEDVGMSDVEDPFYKVLEENYELLLKSKGNKCPELFRCIDVANNEILNARDCLENRDFAAAMLQIRYAATVLIRLIMGCDNLKNECCEDPLGALPNSGRVEHKVREMLELAVQIRGEKSSLRDEIEILRDFAKNLENELGCYYKSVHGLRCA
ncbi:MAG: nucleotidyltransferase domain-containing protein [Candidatus Bathyarchaeota archaeon]|nr:nucleotidyltransferase domain-containing protein [Candidatus Bathyarchaeota archaeon]